MLDGAPAPPADTRRCKGKERRGEESGPSLFGEALIWSGSVPPPLLLAALHVEQRLAGSKEARSCVSWMQLKIYLAANGKFPTEGQTYITYQREIGMLHLGQKGT